MTYFSGIDWKLVFPWFPQQKAYWIFPVGFGLLWKICPVVNKRSRYLHVL